jgi:hypothetical protein
MFLAVLTEADYLYALNLQFVENLEDIDAK